MRAIRLATISLSLPLYTGQLREIDGKKFAKTAFAQLGKGRLLAPIMGIARQMLYEIVGLQNVMENDFSSLLDAQVGVVDTVQEM